MPGLVLHLQSSTQYERIEQVSSFIGEDLSGSFGILPGHARMMSLLTFGLARFRIRQLDWEYLALPGALVYLAGDQLYLNTRAYLRSADHQAMQAALRERFLAEEQELHSMKRSVQRLEQEMLKRLVEMNRERV